MIAEEKYYWAALLACPGIGNRSLQKLRQLFTSVNDLWQADAATLQAVGQLSEQMATKVAKFCQSQSHFPEQLWQKCQQLQISICVLGDEAYPASLAEIFDPPAVLYYRGTLQPQAMRLAIVGARKYTSYGEGVAADFAYQLARADVTVVSGAARGIDTSAHRGALRGGRTVAVLGCGVDVAYPPENKRLLAEIVAKGGAVIAEYPPGTKPLPAYFPARNRIISGLVKGVVVVEAAKKSGSLITAEQALAENRDVFAVPGSIYSVNSQGTNLLIQQGAKLVQQASDILDEYRLSPPPKESTLVKLTTEERRIYRVLSFEHPLTMDEIIMSLSDDNMPNLAFVLLQMEMKGLIVENEMHAYRRAERE